MSAMQLNTGNAQSTVHFQRGTKHSVEMLRSIARFGFGCVQSQRLFRHGVANRSLNRFLPINFAFNNSFDRLAFSSSAKNNGTKEKKQVKRRRIVSTSSSSSEEDKSNRPAVKKEKST